MSDDSKREKARNIYVLLRAMPYPSCARLLRLYKVSTFDDMLSLDDSTLEEFRERAVVETIGGGDQAISYGVDLNSHAIKIVTLPPGFRLAEVLRFLLTRKAFERFVAPTIADMQEEYVDALVAGRIWHARWIAVRGHLLVIPGWLYAFFAGKLSEFLKKGH